MLDSADKFIEAEGVVHLTLGEFTLCGDAFDMGSHEPGYEWKPARSKAVSCKRCAAIIELCRGVRITSHE